MSPLVERLRGLDTAGGWVVSCYLKLEPRDRTREKYLIKLKNRIREREAKLETSGMPRAARAAVSRELDRVWRYVEGHVGLLSGQGLAVFACEAAGLFEAVGLPRVFRSRLVVDRTPLVRELAALADEFGMMLCAAFDRTSARLFRVTAFQISELPGITPGRSTRAGRFHGTRVATGRGTITGAAGEHNYNQRIRIEKQRHYATIAQRLFELTRAHPVQGVVLAGIGGDAGALIPHLHPYVQGLVLGTVRLNPKAATPAHVQAEVLKVRREAERRSERERLRMLENGLGTGWAVNGLDPTLRALARGQVRTLLVDSTLARPGFRCVDSGRLATTRRGCGPGTTAEPLEDLVDEAIEEALRQRSQIDLLEDTVLARRIKGLAAILRFKAESLTGG